MFLSNIKHFKSFYFPRSGGLHSCVKTATRDWWQLLPEKRVLRGAGQRWLQRNFPTVPLLRDLPGLMAHPQPERVSTVRPSNFWDIYFLEHLLRVPKPILAWLLQVPSSNYQIHFHLTTLFLYRISYFLLRDDFSFSLNIFLLQLFRGHTMALWVRRLAAKPDNQSSIWEHTGRKNKALHVVPWHPRVCHGVLNTHMHTHAHT